MKVSDILRVKGQSGGTLFTIDPMDPLADAVKVMAEKDMGSLLVMEHGDLVGMSSTSRPGLPTVSPKKSLVLGRTAARQAAMSLGWTNVVSMPKRRMV